MPCMNLLNSCELSGTSLVRPTELTPEMSCFFFLGFLAGSWWPCSVCATRCGCAFSAWPCSTSAWPCSLSAWPCSTSAWPCSPWPCSPPAWWSEWPCASAAECPCSWSWVQFGSMQRPFSSCSWSCSPSSCSLSYSSSASAIRSREKALMPRILSRGTREFRVSICSAKELIEPTVSLSSFISARLTRSVLLSRILSAKATCCTASLTVPSGRTSLIWSLRNMESTRQTTPSTRKWVMISGCWKVFMIGAGSARPVVSNMTMSNFSSFFLSPCSERTRSPRTVQQAQPLSMLITSSATFMFSATRPVSMLIAPNSFSMTQIFLPWSSLST
mmetsp:Transcript_128/g.332  ORF Transcript_128/g.332 Transcript_128/m.332 type:complete len:330 (-) Transcript_128:396-1385(-)